jgi:DNA-binding NarL/FixJ family response regulator
MPMSESRPVRVVFAEDSFLLREGVLRLLATRAEIDVVGTCDDLPSLVALVEAECPDVVVTDIRMPPTHLDEGIQAADRFRASHPELGVVVLSQYVLPDYAVALFEHGSAGRAYLLKERVADLEQLLGAISVVARGGSVVDPKIVDALIAGRARRSDSPLDALTPREREILGEMA